MRRLAASISAAVLACGCGSGATSGDAGAPDASAGVADAAAPPASASASAEVDAGAEADAGVALAPLIACPREMMAVDNRFCVDKWEASLVDKRTGRPISPYYPPDRRLAVKIAEQWEHQRAEMGSEKARAIPLPIWPAWQRGRDVEPMAVSRAGVVPNGYLSGVVAAEACKNAGKRLCAYDEWLTACKGEAKRQFPYGDEYRQGACNIFRRLHPAMELHDNAAIGHSDPRLNLVKDGADPLLRRTGATAACKSEWGDDAAWDMNGNLDEWVEDDKGHFVGGFFSRSKRDGCDSSVRAHPNEYFDYSTGVRCCSAPE